MNALKITASVLGLISVLLLNACSNGYPKTGTSGSLYSQAYQTPALQNQNYTYTQPTTSTGTSTTNSGTSTLAPGNLTFGQTSQTLPTSSSIYFPPSMYQWSPIPQNQYNPPPTASFNFQAIDRVIFSAGENSHLFSGAPCPSNAPKFAGNIADCGGGQCNGNEVMCLDQDTYNPAQTPNKQIAVDFYISVENAHVVGGPNGGACPANYSLVASAADCGGGTCYGNQLFCVARVPLSSVTPGAAIVTDIYFTPSGSHVVGGPGCRPGYYSKGSVADCGGGTCYGNQLICVAYAHL